MVPSGMGCQPENLTVCGLNGLSWLDEAAFMPLIIEVWSNLVPAPRVGENPKILVTTTPRPTKWIKEPSRTPDHYCRVSTYENLHNLPRCFEIRCLRKFEGTPAWVVKSCTGGARRCRELTLKPEMIPARQRI